MNKNILEIVDISKIWNDACVFESRILDRIMPANYSLLQKQTGCAELR